VAGHKQSTSSAPRFRRNGARQVYKPGKHSQTLSVSTRAISGVQPGLCAVPPGLASYGEKPQVPPLRYAPALSVPQKSAPKELKALEVFTELLPVLRAPLCPFRCVVPL
jgi:hypothetical protein